METIRDRGAPDAPPISLAVFRLAVGLMLVDMALQKAPWVITDGHRYGWLYGWLQKEVAHPTFDAYQRFLEHVVLPNFSLFGALAFAAEVGLGVSLVFGLFTVLGGIGGALWHVNIALGSYRVPGEWGWIWMLLIFLPLVFAEARAGRRFGIDGLLRRLLAAPQQPRSGLRRVLAWVT